MMARSFIREAQILDADVITEEEHASLDHTGIPGCSGTTFSGAGYSGDVDIVTEISDGTFSKGVGTFENGLLTTFSGGVVSSGTIGTTAAWTTISGSYTVTESEERLVVHTSSAAVTITLKSSPSVGCEVFIADGDNSFFTNNCTIARNGSNIEGFASDFILNVDRADVHLVYSNSTIGWRVLKIF